MPLGLSADQLAVSIVLATMLVLFAWGRLPYELVAMLGLPLSAAVTLVAAFVIPAAWPL